MRSLPLIAVVCALSGCGGGGGGVDSTPAPPIASPTPTPPSTPAPTNTTLGDLRYDQNFATDAATTSTVLDTRAAVVTTAGVTRGALQVRYDAASQSYTVQNGSRSQTFTNADKQTSVNPGETRYVRTDGATRDYLTLAVTPYTGSTSNRYVGLGYWQRNTGGGGTQNTTFDSFVYGFDTPASAVPRTGTAGYVTDAFGFVTTPGKPPRAFVGAGTFDLDLASGLFRTQASVNEYDLTSDASVSGGGIELIGSGHLGGGNGFSGNFTYGGQDATVSGNISGRFFGPAAEEIGASFAADNADGAAVSGSLTGVRSGNVPAATQALTNIVADKLFYSAYTELAVTTETGSTPAYRGASAITGGRIGQTTIRPDGSMLVVPPSSDMPSLDLTAADRVASTTPNVTSYEKVVDGQTIHVDLYKPGSANNELALTYASFGIWRRDRTNGAFNQSQTDYFLYGVETDRSLLSRRTGTGRYDGAVHGAADMTGTRYEVGGTSRFDVDFGAQRYTGSLTLNGTPIAGGAAVNFGTWGFGSGLQYGQMNETPLARSGQPAEGSIAPRFYGPDGEEIAGIFAVNTGSGATALSIAGATVAKRR